MSQTVSNVGLDPINDAARMKYGGGILTLALFVLLLIGMLYAYEDFTSGRVEWHLFSKSLPVIPYQIMVALWWAATIMWIGGIILSVMPSVSVIIDSDKIEAQSIYTRKFKTIYFNDILGVVYSRNYISIVDRRNNKIYLGKLFMKSSDYKLVKAKLHSSSALLAQHS